MDTNSKNRWPASQTNRRFDHVRVETRPVGAAPADDEAMWDHHSLGMLATRGTVHSNRAREQEADLFPFYHLDDDATLAYAPAQPAPKMPVTNKPQSLVRRLVGVRLQGLHSNATRAAVGLVVVLTLLSASLIALLTGSLGITRAAVRPYVLYGDSLARGWRDDSSASTINYANSSPVQAGYHSIAWRANSGWATLYLQDRVGFSPAGYSLLTFAAQASHSGQTITVVLTDSHNRRLSSPLSLASYGGQPVVGQWKLYAIPLSALDPKGLPFYGMHFQNQSSAPAPVMYLDSITLLAGSTAQPVSTAASTAPASTSTVNATTTPVPTTVPAAGASYPGLPLTTANIHVGLPFNYNVSSPSSESGRVDYVWGSSYSTQPTSTYNTYYYPFEREPSNGHDLAWFRANHPDWVEYKCDRTTPAYEYGHSNVPLDLANPAVLNYIWSTYLAPHLAAGYHGVAFDNVHLHNWVPRCGHYDQHGTWVQQYSGTSYETAYENTVIGWAQFMYTHVHSAYPGDTVSMNFTYESHVQALSYQLFQYMDIDVDESGFSNMPSSSWLADMQAYAKLMSLGHGLFSLNEEPQSFSSLTTAEKQWALANYLLIKNQYTFIYIAGSQQYGSLLLLPEYSAQIGSPTNSMYASQNVYMRYFTNGLALVNPSASSSYTVTLSGTHHDLYGHVVGNTVTLAPRTGLVLLKG